LIEDGADFNAVLDVPATPTGPPVGLLALAGACLLASLLLMIPAQPITWVIGYIMAALGAVSAVALFRFVDGRRRSSAGYRINPFAARVAGAVLVVSWLVSCGHAWLLATVWSRR